MKSGCRLIHLQQTTMTIKTTTDSDVTFERSSRTFLSLNSRRTTIVSWLGLPRSVASYNDPLLEFLGPYCRCTMLLTYERGKSGAKTGKFSMRQIVQKARVHVNSENQNCGNFFNFFLNYITLFNNQLSSSKSYLYNMCVISDSAILI